MIAVVQCCAVCERILGPDTFRGNMAQNDPGSFSFLVTICTKCRVEWSRDLRLKLLRRVHEALTAMGVPPPFRKRKRARTQAKGAA